MVWASPDPYLAAGDLPDLYFYLGICLAVGNGGQSAAGPAFQPVWASHFAYHFNIRPVRSGLVWHIKFHGVRGSADVSSPKGG